MMYKPVKQNLVFIILFFLLYSCIKEESSNVVTLEPTVNKKLTLGQVSDIIQLETTEESMLEFVTKTFIDRQNNRIFVNSDMNIFLFDLKGKYITKLKKGKGPGEINMVVSFAADSKNKRIFVLDLGSIIVLPSCLDFLSRPIGRERKSNLTLKDRCLKEGSI